MSWWDTVKGWFGRGEAPATEPELRRIPAAGNPWGVDVLDISAFTQGVTSFTQNADIARRYLEVQRWDGRELRDVEPEAPVEVEVDLSYPVEGLLHDGVIHRAREMEDKWALFVVDSALLFVRSWTGALDLRAPFEIEGEELRIRRVVCAGDHEAHDVERMVDTLLRLHAWDEPWPVPVPEGLMAEPQTAATYAFGLFGRRARFCSEQAPSAKPSPGPLRVNTLLHIAAVQGDLDAARAQLDDGVSPDVRGNDGFAPIWWAMVDEAPEAMMALLTEAGGSVDVRDDEGVTPLMTAVQRDRDDVVAWLLAHGADVDATDGRGFTALHRAAEMGHVEIARRLLGAGASPSVEAMGHTPRSLAAAHDEIRALFEPPHG